MARLRKKNDKAGAFLWAALSDLWTYSANRVPEISDSIVEIDRAMKLGFNWEMGPFELWDAAGVEATVERMKKEGKADRRESRATHRIGKKGLVPGRSAGRFRSPLFRSSDQRLSPRRGGCGRWSVAVAKKIKRPWSRRTRARRSLIWATVWAASSSIRK